MTAQVVAGLTLLAVVPCVALWSALYLLKQCREVDAIWDDHFRECEMDKKGL